jgi:hypothetical protein
MVFLLRYVYSKTTEQIELTILLPLIVKSEEMRVEPLKGYSPPFRANALLATLGKNRELTTAFAQDWQKKIARGVLRDDGVSGVGLCNLLVSMLVSLIRLYGEHTLTTTSLYHKEYRTHAWKFKPYSLEVEELHDQIHENIFLKPGALKLPENVRLYLIEEEEHFRGVRIDSPYCWVTFKILPYWKIITEENSRKSFNIVKRNIKREDVEILGIPLQITMGINRKRIFAKMVKDHYIWMHGLMSDSIKWLSWEEYEKGDLERLVVELGKDIHQIVKNVDKKEGNSEDS